MFKDALMESEGRLTTKSKYFSLISIALNGLLLLALVLWPLLHPLALPKQALSVLLVAPAPPASAAPRMRAAVAPHAEARSEPLSLQLQVPSQIPKTIRTVSDANLPASNIPVGMGSGGYGNEIGEVLSSSGSRVMPSVVAATPKKIAISSGVMAGKKSTGTDPTYPAIAKSARIQGTVILQATISKTGTIENLRVLSGPPMLVSSAIDAVKTWRYRPYQLNNEPVEVETTINVVFNLGS